MEKPLFKYKNRFRNILILAYWVIITFILIISIIIFNPINIIIYNILGSLVWAILIWQFKLLSTYIYVDAIVFKEIGLQIPRVYMLGVIFENISEINIYRKGFAFQRIRIKKKDGKTVSHLVSFSKNELSEFSRIIKEKGLKMDIE